MNAYLESLGLAQILTPERMFDLLRAAVTLVVGLVLVRLLSGTLARMLRGRMGAQESMLLKRLVTYLLVGLVPVDEGRILVDDVDVTHRPVNVRSGLGLAYLPQDASIFRKLTVAQNIMAILEIRSHLDDAARRDRLQQLLEDLGISRKGCNAFLDARTT